MSSNDSVKKRVERQLRVEAGAAQWQEFDESQQQAYMRIAKMIAEAVGDMPPLDQSPTESDTIRRTRSAFVIGGRGTGKTTVLDTFRRDSRPGAAWTAGADQPRPHVDEGSRQRQLAQSQERQDLLQQIRGRVVWLETLDMEPLPPDTNLLASILVRLEDAARSYGGESGPPSRRPQGLIEPSSEYHSALLDLQRLQTDVALAWDGNLRQRQGALDPDAYAVEVMRVEKARLSLNVKFSKTLRKLATHVFQGRDVKDALFILPVDDFDLNPPICLDLLRVLRLISIPRLFTIVLGDLHVASTVLSLKLSNDLGSIVRQLQFPMLAVLPQTVASLAGDVAANAIRKLLPPGQRIELWPMRLPEAMNFRPLGSRDIDPFLHELFGACPVNSGWALPQIRGTDPTPLERDRSSLRQLLLAPALTAGPEDAKVRPVSGTIPGQVSPLPRALSREAAEAAVYSGTRFIQAPPRRVADTWLELYKITPAEGAVTTSENDDVVFEPLLTYFAEACRAALRETPIFVPAERDDVERGVSRTVAGAWTLRALPLSFRTETTASRPVELTPRRDTRAVDAGRRKSLPDRGVLPAVHFHTAESLGWQMEVYRDAGTGPPENRRPDGRSDWEERRPGRLLSENAVSALIMYHDLLAFAPRGGGTFVTPLLTPSSVEIDWATTEWKVQPPVRFTWPAPPCTTFFDYDRFRTAWNVAIKDPEIIQATGHEYVVERLAFAWLSIGTAVATKKPRVGVKSWDAPLPWRALVDKLEEMAEEASKHQSADASRYTEWLKRVAELLMPEMGLPHSVISQFVRPPATMKHVWFSNRLAVRQRRVERLRELHEADPALADYAHASPLGREFTPERSEFGPAPASGSSARARPGR